MKILMTGGTGFVGTTLTHELTAKGHSVTVLMRKVRSAKSLPPGAANLPGGGPHDPGGLAGTGPGARGLHQPAGSSIFTRWTDEAKRSIRESRLLTTRHLVEALLAPRKGKETHLFSTSAVGYYGFHGDEDLIEESPPRNGFLAKLAREWEAEAVKAKEHGAQGRPDPFRHCHGSAERRHAGRGRAAIRDLSGGQPRQWQSVALLGA